MKHTSVTAIVFACFLFVLCGGCGRSGDTAFDSEKRAADRQQLDDAVAKAEQEAQDVEPPAPRIALVTPSGWTKTETRPLPAADHGFTVAYEHESGLAVTLYQFTRGRNFIPNDIDSEMLNNEMRKAKKGIQQAVELGYWQTAKETAAKKVKLGESVQQAQWSQFLLSVDDMELTSDIYVWAQNNTFFKLRCTSRSKDAASNQIVLKPLLTAFGSPDGEAN